MRYDPTPALTFALGRAYGYARRDGAAAVGPRHLLLGLLGEEEGRPARLLAQAGVGRAGLRRALGLDEGTSTEAEELPLEAATRSILARAAELAALHSAEGTVSSDQALAALLELDDELRGRLVSLGLNLA